MFVELSHILETLSFPADWVSLRAIRQHDQFRSVRDQLLDNHGHVLHQGVMVEVMLQGQIGYGAVNSFTPHHILAAAETAYRHAKSALDWNLAPIALSSRPNPVGNYRSPRSDVPPMSTGEIIEILQKISGTLKLDERIVQTVAELTLSDVETWFVSSSGAEVYQSFSRIATNYQATAQQDDVIQMRSDHGWLARCYQGGVEFFLTDDLWERVQTIGEQAIELLSAPECPSETTTLMLAPDQMLLQIHESIGHPLELDRILGDERNYAGGSFVKPDDFGHLVYGSPKLNVTFDPQWEHECASYAFDDTGAIAAREYLIKDGILLRGLGSLDSQKRLNVPGVASARANSWNRPPIDRMANLNLEPGEESVQDLLSGIERGVYMESNRSWSIDDQRHKFQFSCEYGKLIENGKLTQTVRNPSYRGITPQFWGNLVGVGDRASWQVYGTPSCGKGEPNQLITVGHASPVAVFSQVEVLGGEGS